MKTYNNSETDCSDFESASQKSNTLNFENRTLKKFFIGKEIGRGNFGKIFQASKVDNIQSRKNKTSSSNRQLFAVKCEPLETSCLSIQSTIYKALNPWGTTKGFPMVYGKSLQGDHQYMVMEMLGKNLQNLFVQNHQRFNLSTILKIGLQALDRIQHMHSKGYIHLDLKPANFLAGLNQKSSIVYLTDMGLSKRFKQKSNQQHIAFSLGNERCGTLQYCSISCHLRYQQSRRDDIQSILYTILYFLKGGKLPWSNVKGFNVNDQWNRVLKIKQNNSIVKKSCQQQNFLQLWSLINYARNLKFQDTPNYDYIRTLLKDKFDSLNVETQELFV